MRSQHVYTLFVQRIFCLVISDRRTLVMMCLGPIPLWLAAGDSGRSRASLWVDSIWWNGCGLFVGGVGVRER